MAFGNTANYRFIPISVVSYLVTVHGSGTGSLFSLLRANNVPVPCERLPYLYETVTAERSEESRLCSNITEILRCAQQ
jgi:hypothetical protein